MSKLRLPISTSAAWMLEIHTENYLELSIPVDLRIYKTDHLHELLDDFSKLKMWAEDLYNLAHEEIEYRKLENTVIE